MVSPARPRWRRDRAGQLADFVPRDIGSLLPSSLRRSLPVADSGDPLDRARVVFTTLAQAEIRYGHEPTTSEPGRQVIRPAREILAGPRNGTCLDLAVVYAGVYIDAGVHPIVVVLDPVQSGMASHAIILLWIGGNWAGRPDPDYPDFADDDSTNNGDDQSLMKSQPPGLLTRLRATVETDAPGDFVAVDSSWVSESAPGRAAAPNSVALWAAAVHRGSELLRDSRWRWGVGVDIGTGFDPRRAHDTLATPRIEPLVPPYHEADTPSADGPLAQLRPRRGAVRFCARDELDALRDWFETNTNSDQPGLRIAIVHGVGGSGKTRLAAELCHQLIPEGWYAGFTHRSPSAEVIDYLADVAQPLLITVDYPEGIPEKDLIALLGPLATREEPTGILLLARQVGDESGQWWDTFAKRAREEAIPMIGPRVIHLAAQHPNLTMVFRQARKEFLCRNQPIDQPQPAASENVPLPPPPWVGKWTTLDVVMLAWLSAVEETPQAPATRSQLYETIWEHELDHWKLTYR